MGVPKFFRWMSERYPAISQLIAENRIPEFDCLYLDMNGIIHNCTHSDSDSPTHRMSEDKMFIAIFNYIEHLYSKIKPKELFFMAIDGVAPRAKMNQQRARRFRTALDNEKAREKAIREGLEMPKEPPFDSNCITPGTDFMARLTKQLKYFISKKVSEDIEWQGVEIVLSGHEVPGEGEHKIMEYIRQAKAQQYYNPNVRHCLYGLDADLIMLGLLSHDPHFCLLREEVRFGRETKKQSKELEHQNFYLMHLCIVREYLELEFQELKEPGALSFDFDMERVIDDFILMAFFVGNDFLPNLPNLHINEGALALMFKVYKSVLPKAGGYLNNGGVIDLQRLRVLLEELQDVEYRFFESEVSDAAWFKGKQMGREDVMAKRKPNGKPQPLIMSTAQKELWKQIKTFVNSRPAHGPPMSLDLDTSLPARDRKFVEETADALHLQWKTVTDDAGNRHMRLDFHPKPEDIDDSEEDDDEEAHLALVRVIKRYDNARVVDVSAEEARENERKKYDQKFLAWKDKYYVSKLGWGLADHEDMKKFTENYVQGLQWVLYYYYRGVVSWPWFFRYHYSPMISDVKHGLGVNMDFNLGQPFKPYQQLMGVLPDRSKSIVPQCYWPLMTDPDSPIIDFYPRDFELDMNGKKQDWEAVVKIPFIDETRLLPAMATKDHLLAQDERERNEFGVTLKFTYSSELDFTYPSSLPGIFPDLPHSHCVENIFDLPTMDGLDVRVGLVEGVKLGVSALAGFPSLSTLPHHGALDFHGVSVFQQDSRNESQVVTIHESEERASITAAKQLLGKRVFVGYPFLQESKVVRVSDEMFDYLLSTDGVSAPMQVPHGPKDIEAWRSKAGRIENVYSKRFAIVTGQVDSLVHVETLKGLTKTAEGATVKEFALVPGVETDYAAQMVVHGVENEDPRFVEKAALPIEEEFPVGTRGFGLGGYGYGRPLEVTGHRNGKADAWVSVLKVTEPDFSTTIIKEAERLSPYTPSYAVAKKLGLNPLTLSKITASFQVSLGDQRLNLGLNLKFEAKKLKVLGYSRRSANGWEFSQKAVELVQQYMIQFPEFIATIQANPKGDIFHATDFFPADQAPSKIKAIQDWLKGIQSKSFERVPLDAEQMDSEVVMKLEQAADQILQTTPAPDYRPVKGMPRNALLKPADAEHRLGNQRFSIGHRVVYVQDSGRVPIAARGTVVGITRTARAVLLDVVFDRTFMSGTTLNDRCTPFRGSTVPVTSVLNLTDRQLEVGSKASDARRPQSANTPLTINGYGQPLGPNGAGQLHPANAPPPLRGSWRGALAGSPGSMGRGGRGGRGGGGGAQATNGNGQPQQQQLPIRSYPGNTILHTASQPGAFCGGGRGAGYQTRPNHQSYAPIDNGQKDASVVNRNPNFVARDMTNVPPPSSLDAGAPSRGRGRGRARGDSSRARGDFNNGARGGNNGLNGSSGAVGRGGKGENETSRNHRGAQRGRGRGGKDAVAANGPA